MPRRSNFAIIWQSYEKTREMQKKNAFLFISECLVSSAKPELRKNERNAKEKRFSFHFRVPCKFGEARVTKNKRVCFYFRDVKKITQGYCVITLGYWLIREGYCCYSLISLPSSFRFARRCRPSSASARGGDLVGRTKRPPPDLPEGRLLHRPPRGIRGGLFPWCCLHRR